MATDRLKILDVEPGRWDRPRNHLARMIEEVAVVRCVTREPDDDSHPACSPRSSRPLGVVGRTRRDVPHGHGFEIADVDAHLQRRRTCEQVRACRNLVHEALFDLLTLLVLDRRRMFRRIQRRSIVLHSHECVEVSFGDCPLPRCHAPRAAGARAGFARRLVRCHLVAHAATQERNTDLELDIIKIDLVAFALFVFLSHTAPREVVFLMQPSQTGIERIRCRVLGMKLPPQPLH